MDQKRIAPLLAFIIKAVMTVHVWSANRTIQPA